jgi:hypothetical protein
MVYYSACKVVYVLFYGCQTWPVVLREEHRLRMFENNVLNECVYEVTGSCRKMYHNY